MSKELNETRKSNNPAGRPKGAVNKRTLEARAVFDEEGFDPIKEALKKLKDVTDPELYITTCLKLARFYYPELKAIDHRMAPDKLTDKELIEETLKLAQELKDIE